VTGHYFIAPYPVPASIGADFNFWVQRHKPPPSIIFFLNQQIFSYTVSLLFTVYCHKNCSPIRSSIMRLDSPLTQSGALSKNIAEKAYTIKVINKENHMQNYSANDILTIICGSIFRNTYISYFLTFLKVKKILFSRVQRQNHMNASVPWKVQRHVPPLPPISRRLCIPSWNLKILSYFIFY